MDNNDKTLTKSIRKYKEDALNNTSESLEFLPNEIIYELSNHLIQLTGLKQKISFEQETVSIETDIGLMTKPQYFKWIKHEIETFKY